MSRDQFIPPAEKYHYVQYFHSVGRDTINVGFARKFANEVDWSGGSFPLLTLSVVWSGKGTYIDEDQRKYQLGPGSVFLRIPGRPHQMLVDVDSGWFEFFIGFFFMSPNLELATSEKGYMPFNRRQRGGRLKLKAVPGQEDSWVLPMCNHIFRLAELGPVRQVEVTEELFNDCVAFMERFRQEKDLIQLPLETMSMVSRILHASRSLNSESLITRVQSILKQNVTSSTSLEGLLKNLPLGYVAIRKRFREATGMSLGQYQIQCRLDEAFQLLHKGKSILEVARLLGYSDHFYFSKQFAQKFGYPPSFVRRKRPAPDKPR